MKRRGNKKYRRNPADVILGAFMSAEERDCIRGLRDAAEEQGLRWNPNDQEIAQTQFCPILMKFEEIEFEVGRSNMPTSEAITGLVESVFRLGQILGVIDSNDVENHNFWREITLDVVRSIEDLLIDLRG